MFSYPLNIFFPSTLMLASDILWENQLASSIASVLKGLSTASKTILDGAQIESCPNWKLPKFKVGKIESDFSISC